MTMNSTEAEIVMKEVSEKVYASVAAEDLDSAATFLEIGLRVIAAHPACRPAFEPVFAAYLQLLARTLGVPAEQN